MQTVLTGRTDESASIHHCTLEYRCESPWGREEKTCIISMWYSRGKDLYTHIVIILGISVLIVTVTRVVWHLGKTASYCANKRESRVDSEVEVKKGGKILQPEGFI
jgi:hypothetical protein